MSSRERFLAACRGQQTDRPPVWLLRQAGRYLPEYRELRARHSFWEMLRTPQLAVEASLQPIRRFGMDASILFSDILIVLDAMGIEVRYEEGGPSLQPLVRGAAERALLRPVDPDRAFDYVGEALQRLCGALHPETAVIGFAGAPFTLAAYLVAGGPSHDVEALKTLAQRDPALYADLAEQIAQIVAGLLRLQIRAGADAVQLFDTWSVHLSPEEYTTLALPATRRVIELLSDLEVPIILYIRHAVGHLEAAAQSGCHVLSIDSSLRLADARARLDSSIALQGNFDPALLTQPPEIIREQVQQAMADLRGSGYIVNLGQGLVPQTPIAGVAALVEAVRSGGV